MAKIQVVDQNNKKVGDFELAPEVFEVEIMPEILNHVVRAQRASARQGTHATKNRALKTGGGLKPWRQKAPVVLVLAPSVRLCGVVVLPPSARSLAITPSK